MDADSDAGSDVTEKLATLLSTQDKQEIAHTNSNL